MLLFGDGDGRDADPLDLEVFDDQQPGKGVAVGIRVAVRVRPQYTPLSSVWAARLTTAVTGEKLALVPKTFKNREMPVGEVREAIGSSRS